MKIIKGIRSIILFGILSEDLRPRKLTQARGIKTLTPKQMLQRLLILHTRVETGNMLNIYRTTFGKLSIHCIV